MTMTPDYSTVALAGQGYRGTESWQRPTAIWQHGTGIIAVCKTPALAIWVSEALRVYEEANRQAASLLAETAPLERDAA